MGPEKVVIGNKKAGKCEIKVTLKAGVVEKDAWRIRLLGKTVDKKEQRTHVKSATALSTSPAAKAHSARHSRISIE